MAVKNILKCLRSTKDLFLIYGDSDLNYCKQVYGCQLPN